MKSKSAVSGKYVSAKTAKAKPATTFKSDDYPARMLRKIVRMFDNEDVFFGAAAGDDLGITLIANIKKRMNWK